MKKLLIIPTILIIMFASFSADVSAQRVTKKYNHAISGDLLNFLAWGSLYATYEQQVSAQNSFTVNAVYWSWFDWTAVGIGGSYRWYLLQESDRALKGFSFGPTLNIGFWSHPADRYTGLTYNGGTSISIGGEAAYKFVFDSFVLEPILRFSFNASSIDYLDYKPFGFGCNLGYAW